MPDPWAELPPLTTKQQRLLEIEHRKPHSPRGFEWTPPMYEYTRPIPEQHNPTATTSMPDTTAEQRLEQLYQARIEYFRAYEACWRDAVTTSTSGDAFLNGVVFPDGTIVSSRPIEDGTYEVVSWNGTDAVNTAEVLTIANGIGTPSGISFAIKP